MKILYNNKVKLKLNNIVIDNTIDDFEILDYYPQLKLLKNCNYYFKKYSDYYFCYNYVFKDIKLSDMETEIMKKIKSNFLGKIVR